MRQAAKTPSEFPSEVITLSKVEVSAAPAGGQAGPRLPLTGRHPAERRPCLPAAGGLSAGPRNLPDRSLQVPLIPLIQFI